MAPSARYPSEDVDASPLGQPLKFEFSGRSAPNRFLKAAMTERLSSFHPTNLEARGIPSKELINLYRRWGEADYGVVLTGNVMIAYDHLEGPGNAVIARDSPFSGERFEAFKEMATQGTKKGNFIVAQVSHPGRQAIENMQPNPVSASDVQLVSEIFGGIKFGKPHAASLEEILDIIDGFAHAAEYLDKAGFDGIQLHGAHGYLLAQFLSQTTNRRTDKYGGSLENRARIIVEIGQEIRKRTSPTFTLGIKLNSVEFQEGGLQPEESLKMCSILEDNTFDFVELSGGTYEAFGFEHKRESTKKREAFFIEFADMIAPTLSKTKVYVTGGFKTVGAMVAALKTVDGVGLGRPACQEPRLARDILDGRVKGAIQPAFENDSFLLTNTAAGSHIWQIGKDVEPTDLSRKDNVEKFQSELAAMREEMMKTKDPTPRYVEFSSVPTVPYGTITASL